MSMELGAVEEYRETVDKMINLRDLMNSLMAVFRIGNVMGFCLTFGKPSAIIKAGAERPREVRKKSKPGVESCPGIWSATVRADASGKVRFSLRD